MQSDADSKGSHLEGLMTQRLSKIAQGSKGAAILLATLALCGCNSAGPRTVSPPAGGQEFILDYEVFASSVNPILTAKGCDNLFCHGGGLRGTFELSPFDDKDIDFDFEQVLRQLNPLRPENSSLLTKPLAPAAGGDEHTAATEHYGFMSKTDSDYQTLLAWIQAGELR